MTVPSVSYGYCQCGCGGKSPISDRTDRKRGYVKGRPHKFIHNHHTRLNGPTYILRDMGYQTPCWVWQLCRYPSGYGQTKDNGRQRPAHCIYWEREHGPVPVGLELHHLCGVPACVNPEHLRPLTRAEHIRSDGRSKLTREQVDEIKELYQRREATQLQLATRYGVSQVHVSSIVRDKAWRR